MTNGNAFNQRLIIEPKQQTHWKWNHATWFTSMGIGGALYLDRVLFGIDGWQLLGISAMEILSFVLIGIGGLILIADLGRPERFWRALINLRSSWISWGAAADFAFLLAAPLSAVPNLAINGSRPLAWLPWGSGGTVDLLLLVVGVMSAFFIIVYPAFVLAAFPSIPFWNNPTLPVQFVGAAFASAGALGLFAPEASEQQVAVWVTAVGLLVWLVFVTLHCISAVARCGAARLGAKALWSGHSRGWFHFAFWLGMVIPLALSAATLRGAQFPTALWVVVGACMWVANWVSKRVLLGVGYFEPLL